GDTRECSARLVRGRNLAADRVAAQRIGAGERADSPAEIWRERVRGDERFPDYAAYSGDDRAAIERRRNAGAAASTALGAGHYGGGAGARIEQSGFGKSAGGKAGSQKPGGRGNA